MQELQRDGTKLLADEVYTETYQWLKERSCEKLVSRQLVEQYLSTYFGHAEINSTFYYIHLLPDRIRKSSGINWEMFSSIYEEDTDHEEN